jgi:lipopolysaccharide export system protein LptC
VTSRAYARTFDRISIYLPVILMGVLALGTYWLARSTPSAPKSASRAAPTHEPDYFLRGFSVKSFDPAGRMKSELNGAEAHHYPDTDTTEITKPRMRSYNEHGALTLATADRAVTNGDGSEVQLFGNAVVTREGNDAKGQPQPKVEIRSEFLHLFANSEKLKTNKPVTLKRGDDVFEGDSLDYDNLNRVMELNGRVKGVITPKPGVQ